VLRTNNLDLFVSDSSGRNSLACVVLVCYPVLSCTLEASNPKGTFLDPKIKMTQKIAYSAIVLTDESHNKLVTTFKHRIPEGWEIIAHHCTVNMGPLPAELRQNIGLPVTLRAISFDMDDKVAAVQVVVPQDLDKYIKNKYPHITIAVNRNGGGKPVMSNDMIAKAIQRDEDAEVVGRLFSPISLMGQLQEVPGK